MCVEQVFDFDRRDVFALADDDVLEASRDGDESFVVLFAEVAGAEESVVVKCMFVEGRIEIAAHELRCLDPDLSNLTNPGDISVEGHDLDRYTGSWRTFGVGEVLI